MDFSLKNPSVLRDEREGCRSLVCDANGIIIAEMVYRCMICSTVSESITEAKMHYHDSHIDTDIPDHPPPPSLLAAPSASRSIISGNNNHSSSVLSLDHHRLPERQRMSHLIPAQPSHQDSLVFPEEDFSMELPSEDEEGPPAPSSVSNHRSNHSQASNKHSSNIRFSNNNNNNNSKNNLHSDPMNLSMTYKSSQDSMTEYGDIIVPASPSKRISAVKIQTAGTNGTCTIKSGYITCPVCSCTKFYTTLQRRYGQFSCVGCYRFFKEFFVKPKRYGCPVLGQCSLDQRTKCKGCWMKKCIETYTVDDQRRQLLLAHRPVKKGQMVSLVRNNNSNNNNSISGSSPSESSNNNNVSLDDKNLPSPSQTDHISHDNNSSIGSITGMAAGGTDSAIEGSNEEDEDDQNSLDDVEDLPMDESTENNNHEGSSLLLPPAPRSDGSGGDFDTSGPSEQSSLSQKTAPRRKTSGRIKNWCCLKCANCLADDCGKCINCLDRPKFGGPFIRKQRCLYKKCLMKTKPISPFPSPKH